MWWYLVWGALLLALSQAKECFPFPAKGDYAPLLKPTTKWVHGSTSTEAEVDLSNLFDKSADPLGTGVEFFSATNGSLEVIFDIPRTLPFLDRIKVTGKGKITLTIDDRYFTRKTTSTEELQGSTEYGVYADEKTEAGIVAIKGVPSGTFLTDLQFLASDQQFDESYYDEGGEDSGWAGDDAWGGHDDYHVQEPVESVVGCACAGWPTPSSRGGACGVWDRDCPDGGGWCYVKPGACNDSQQSHSYPTMHWACDLCKNKTAVIPQKPAGKGKVAKPVPPPACSPCTAPLVMGIFLGLAVGVAIMVLITFRKQPIRLVRRGDISDDDEVGHHD